MNEQAPDMSKRQNDTFHSIRSIGNELNQRIESIAGIVQNDFNHMLRDGYVTKISQITETKKDFNEKINALRSDVQSYLIAIEADITIILDYVEKEMRKRNFPE